MIQVDTIRIIEGTEICLILLWGNGGSHKALYRKKMDVLTQNWQHFRLKYKSVGEKWEYCNFLSSTGGPCTGSHLMDWSLLVVKDDVRSPDVVTGHVELLHPAILLRVPLELVVPPELLHPQVGRHYLVLEVL